jgi:hypothetical protein
MFEIEVLLTWEGTIWFENFSDFNFKMLELKLWGFLRVLVHLIILDNIFNIYYNSINILSI